MWCRCCWCFCLAVLPSFLGAPGRIKTNKGNRYILCQVSIIIMLTGALHAFICSDRFPQSHTIPAAEQSTECYSPPWLSVSCWLLVDILLVDNHWNIGLERSHIGITNLQCFKETTLFGPFITEQTFFLTYITYNLI